MLRKRTIITVLAILLALSAFVCGCKPKPSGGDSGSSLTPGATDAPAVTPEPYIPEVIIPESGNWHAEVLFSSQTVREMLPWYARIPLAIFLGNTAFEVDVEISNGNLTYETNTDTLKKSASGTVSTILGFFLKDMDFSMFIDRIAEAVLPETVMGKDRDCYGIYDSEFRDEKDRIVVTTTKGETLYFRAYGNTLVQTDIDGVEVLSFKKVKTEK